MAVDPDTWFSARLGADDDVPAAAAPREERALVSRAIRRDDAALGAIYARHAPAIQRFLRDLVGCPAAAADATQETFVRAFRRIDTLRDEDRLTPWLFGIARNVALEVQKARRVRARYFAQADDGLEAAVVASGATPEAELLGREAAAVVARALARLSEDRRAVLLLRLDHGLAYDEIAAVMGFSLAKVKVEIHRARQALREELEAYGGPT